MGYWSRDRLEPISGSIDIFRSARRLVVPRRPPPAPPLLAIGYTATYRDAPIDLYRAYLLGASLLPYPNPKQGVEQWLKPLLSASTTAHRMRVANRMSGCASS